MTNSGVLTCCLAGFPRAQPRELPAPGAHALLLCRQVSPVPPSHVPWEMSSTFCQRPRPLPTNPSEHTPHRQGDGRQGRGGSPAFSGRGLEARAGAGGRRAAGGVTSESQKSKSLMPVLKFCCLLASFSFWLFSADFCTRNCHWSAKAASRACAREGESGGRPPWRPPYGNAARVLAFLRLNSGVAFELTGARTVPAPAPSPRP